MAVLFFAPGSSNVFYRKLKAHPHIIIKQQRAEQMGKFRDRVFKRRHFDVNEEDIGVKLRLRNSKLYDYSSDGITGLKKENREEIKKSGEHREKLKCNIPRGIFNELSDNIEYGINSIGDKYPKRITSLKIDDWIYHVPCKITVEKNKHGLKLKFILQLYDREIKIIKKIINPRISSAKIIQSEVFQNMTISNNFETKISYTYEFAILRVKFNGNGLCYFYINIIIKSDRLREEFNKKYIKHNSGVNRIKSDKNQIKIKNIKREVDSSRSAKSTDSTLSMVSKDKECT